VARQLRGLKHQTHGSKLRLGGGVLRAVAGMLPARLDTVFGVNAGSEAGTRHLTAGPGEYRAPGRGGGTGRLITAGTYDSEAVETSTADNRSAETRPTGYTPSTRRNSYRGGNAGRSPFGTLPTRSGSLAKLAGRGRRLRHSGQSPSRQRRAECRSPKATWPRSTPRSGGTQGGLRHRGRDPGRLRPPGPLVWCSKHREWCRTWSRWPRPRATGTARRGRHLPAIAGRGSRDAGYVLS